MRCWGVPKVIVGCQDAGIASSQCAAVAAASVAIDLYCFLYFGYDIAAEVNKAIAVARQHPVGRIWIDVEATAPNEAPGMTPEQRTAETWQAVRLVEAASFPVGLYTGQWYWPTYMANTAEFAAYPLWHSEYPYDEHLIPSVAYGGWSRVAIHQYKGSTTLCGKGVDLNHDFDPLMETELPDPRVDKLLAAWGGEGAVDGWNANGNSLLLGYTQLQQTLNDLVAQVSAMSQTLAAVSEQAYGLNTAMLTYYRPALEQLMMANGLPPLPPIF